MRQRTFVHLALLGSAAAFAAGCSGDLHDASTASGANAEHVGTRSEALKHAPVSQGSLTLTFDKFEAATPNDALENRPIFLWFTLTNNTPAWHSGYVEGQVFPTNAAPYGNEWGQWQVTDLAPGQSVSGVVQVKAPRAELGVGLDVYYYEDFERVDEFQTTEGPRLAESTSKVIDVGARYSISMDSAYIQRTRSPYNDTDYAGLAVKQNGGAIANVNASPLPLGNIGDGGHPIGLVTTKFDAIPYDGPDAPVTDVVWSIMNNGGSGSVEQWMNKILNGVSSAAAGILGIAYPGTGNSWGQVNSFVQWINSQIFQGCDGPVAVDHFTMTSAVLEYHTFDDTHSYHDFVDTRTYNWNGKDATYNSPAECGASPEYEINWTLHRYPNADEVLTVTPPNARVAPGGTVQFGAQGTSAVHWRVEGDAATNGYIDETTGLYHAPAQMSGLPIRVRVQSSDGTLNGSAFVGIDTTAKAGHESTAWGTGTTGQGAGALAWLAADFTGDGKTDVIQPWWSNNRLGLITYASNGTSLNFAWGTGDAGSSASALAFLAGDIDGDGTTDLIKPWNNAGTLWIDSIRSSGGAFSTINSQSMGQGAGAMALLSGDVDGDGKADVIQPWNNSGRTGMLVYRSWGRGFTFLSGTGDTGWASSALAWKVGDVNGDGMTDLFQFFDRNGSLGVIVYESNGEQLLVTWADVFTNISSAGANILVGDANGDGCTDLVVVDSSGQISVIVGTGTGMRFASQQGRTAAATAPWFLLGDVNGDKQADLLELSNESQRLGMSVIASEGSWFGPIWTARPNMGQGPGALAWLQGDVNADGLTDVIQPWSNNGELGFLVYEGAR